MQTLSFTAEGCLCEVVRFVLAQDAWRKAEHAALELREALARVALGSRLFYWTQREFAPCLPASLQAIFFLKLSRLARPLPSWQALGNQSLVKAALSSLAMSDIVKTLQNHTETLLWEAPHGVLVHLPLMCLCFLVMATMETVCSLYSQRFFPDVEVTR